MVLQVQSMCLAIRTAKTEPTAGLGRDGGIGRTGGCGVCGGCGMAGAPGMAAPAPGRAWEESEERPVRLGRECIIPWGSSRTFVSNVGLGWVPGGSRFFF